ncbi:hypothetical protein N7462_011615 [Penicillium macrosclerotiorum]|uniref:uncharacterized protein n=1 Tax=Penicillium macrosclerotiorum TaxID=303699 RepID=UPI00254870B5|nr:uncharacterized protein N7462_011615 [Penicillium macrosclerotiorum]KAJ5662689.1 hypothetical protein N7462_011615 [Penicillium macrosclerotiorum]
MVSAISLTGARQRVFSSVFSPASLDAQPAFASFQSSASSSTVRTGSFLSNPNQQFQSGESSLDQDTWDQAWTAAISFLSIPNRGFAPIYESRDTDGSDALKEWNRLSPPSKETAAALECLIHADQHARGPRNLFDWYGDEIRRHFLTNLRSGLYELLKPPEKDGLLRTIVNCLQLARRIYLAPVVHYLLPLLPTTEQGRVLTQIQRCFHTVVSYSLQWSHVSPLLARELAQDALIILGIDSLVPEPTDEIIQDVMDVDRQYSVSYKEWKAESSEVRARMMTEGEQPRVTMSRDRLLAFLNGLQLVGLGGDKAQKVFASVMNIMMTDFVRAAYTEQWESPTSVSLHLRHWVENVFARLAVQALAIIHTPTSSSQSAGALDVSFGDVEKWQEIGIARLGALRTSELFDVIVEWPVSSGAIEDLRHFTTHPAARAYVTQSFITTLNQRLLHPGASTVEILQIYISIIRAFHLLDPKGVLLDRIARPIRRYLRDRDDTVKVIVSGLLAEPTASEVSALPSPNDTLVELATELSRAHQLSVQNNASELDWDDMNWAPDPVDAAPDYRKSKSSDVIDSLISLFDSKETFVKELQTLLGDRLLQKRENYDQEISVLELLKVRFGDSALQACEVMLRDISDSRRVDAVVRNDQGLSKPRSRVHSKSKRPAYPGIPELHAKILSRFFWPEIQDLAFKIPDEIASLQERYSAGFEALKQSRKLTWRNGLGQVLVELELGDRTFAEEVSTWQATVIHAFQSPTEDCVTRDVSDLADALNMAPSLVRSACLFWVSKRILVEVSRDTFRVLEYLPTEVDAPATHGPESDALSEGHLGDAADTAAAAEAAAAEAAKETAEAAAMEKMNLYWQFIVGMLTNQGAMPLQRIVMMLKIVVPGGFPFSNEELRDFLAGMVSRGKLEIASGGNYKLVH